MTDQPILQRPTRKEVELLDTLGRAWNQYLNLPPEKPHSREEFLRAIHIAQNLVLKRCGARYLESVNEMVLEMLKISIENTKYTVEEWQDQHEKFTQAVFDDLQDETAATPKPPRKPQPTPEMTVIYGG